MPLDSRTPEQVSSVESLLNNASKPTPLAIESAVKADLEKLTTEGSARQETVIKLALSLLSDVMNTGSSSSPVVTSDGRECFELVRRGVDAFKAIYNQDADALHELSGEIIASAEHVETLMSEAEKDAE